MTFIKLTALIMFVVIAAVILCDQNVISNIYYHSTVAADYEAHERSFNYIIRLALV